MINLYDVAEKDGIDVYLFRCPSCQSISLPGKIALDADLFGTQERTHLAHELGHCECGAFYNRYAAADVREKHEHRADIWAIKHTIPIEELRQAVKQGVTEPWELAELFGVDEGLMRKAIVYYQEHKPA